MSEEIEPKRRRDRSPSYPAIPLSVAVEKTRELYRQEKGYPAPIATIVQHWGYKPGSGSGSVAIAAVLKFGLIEDEGSGATRRARVSELGQRIVRDNREDSPDRERLIREAALLPSLHRELWDKYGGSLPSDSNLKYTLKFEYGFTDVGAQEFTREFRATIAFARLGDGDDEEPLDPADYPTMSEPAPTTPRRTTVRGPTDSSRLSDRVVAYEPPTTGRAKGMVLPLPIAGSDPDRWPSLHLPDRLTESDWNLMMVVLTAMKPGILRSPVENEEAVATTLMLGDGHQEAQEASS